MLGPDPGTRRGRLFLGATLAIALLPACRREPAPPGRIAFLAAITQLPEIHVMDLDGRHNRRLTPTSRGEQIVESTISWSPDARRIAFVQQPIEQARSRPSGRATLCVADVETGAVRVLGSHESLNGNLAWSPDSTRIAYTARASAPGFEPYGIVDRSIMRGANDFLDYYGQHVIVAHVDGSSWRQVTDTPDEAYLSVSWSPVGDRLAVYAATPAHYWDLYVMAPDGSAKTRLTSDSRAHLGTIARAGPPLWSADGRRILFVGAVGEPMPAWNPNDGSPGARALFMGRSGESAVYAIDYDGSDYRRLIDMPGSQQNPAWSHDGTAIAFSVEIDRPLAAPDLPPDVDRGGIYVVNADGSNPRKITANSLNAMYSVPSWCPGDGHVAFMGAVRENRDPKTLNDEQWRRWIRDQRMHVFIVSPAGGTPSQLTLDGQSGEPVCSPR